MRALAVVKVLDHQKRASLFVLCTWFAGGKPAYFANRTKYKAQRINSGCRLKENCAAVNVDRLAIDAATFFRCEQDCRRRNLVRCYQTILWTHALQHLQRLLR